MKWIVTGVIIIVSCFVIYFSTRITWVEGWKNIPEPSMKGNITNLLDKVNNQIKSADDKDKVLELIRTYEEILKIDTKHYKSLWSLGRYYGLMALAYTETRDEKEEYLLKAINSCEKALYLNKDFKKYIDKGGKANAACMYLTKNEIEALYYYWSNQAAYWYFCHNFFVQMLNIDQVSNASMLISKMIEVDPEWGGGHGYYARAIHYSALPGFMGGDLAKAEEYYQKAIDIGPNWLYIRWGRAANLYKKKKDWEAYKRDLQWVIEQDPHEADSPYPWNVYFQMSASRMLRNMEHIEK